MRTLRPIAFVPGMLFWALLAVGFATDNTTLIGVAVAIALVFVATFITLAVRASAAKRAERKRVWRDGLAMKARVVTIGTGGGAINDHPLVDFELDVDPGNEPAFRVRTSAYVNQLAIPRVQPGCEIGVRLDPRDRNNLVIDEALTPYGYR